MAWYCDARAGGGGRHVSTRVKWCTVMFFSRSRVMGVSETYLVVLYAAFLVGKALLAALRQHPY